jgi:hypothetical protein
LVVGFFGEHGGELEVFRVKNRFGLGFFGCQGELCGCSELSNHGGSHGDKARSAADNSVDDSIFNCPEEVLVLFLPVIELIEFLVGNGVDMNISGGSECGTFEVGVVMGGVHGVGKEEVFRLVEEFRNRQGSLGPIDGGIDFFEPGESKNDVLTSKGEDMEHDSSSDSF